MTMNALAGVTVLEFSHTIMGPCAGLLLADLGARVIKVEPAPGGDKTRYLNGFASGFFATFNRNKESLAVNLKTISGQAVVHQLVEEADVVLENYGPGTMEKLGCGYQALTAINPGLIYLSLKGYLSGPMQQRPALDEVVQFQSGLAYMTGPVGQPLRAGASVIDILGAVFGVTGIMAALRERDVTGRGQKVSSALFETAAFLMAPHMTGGATTGEPLPPMTSRRGAWGVYDVFALSDGSLFIGVTSDAQWQRFCEEFSLQTLYEDTRLATNPQRTSERSWLIPLLSEHFSELSHQRVARGCERADISWAPVGRPEDLHHHEQLLSGRGLLNIALDTARESVVGEVTVPGLPLEFDDNERSEVKSQPPATGEHTRSILTALGYDEQRIAALVADQAVVVSG
jgi:crotonobetainyl-CoA:carnitine CoA-transferase CaiB-like acyl-CoA transferase